MASCDTKKPLELYNKATKAINNIIDEQVPIIHKLMDQAATDGEFYIDYRVPDEFNYITDIQYFFQEYFKKEGFGADNAHGKILRITWFEKDILPLIN